MNSTDQNVRAIQDIRKMMERSSRFISLSGWSGIAAGVTALAGAWVASEEVKSYYVHDYGTAVACPACLRSRLIIIAAAVFSVALISAFIFTYLKSRKERVAIWGNAARRLLWNTVLPMAAGGLLILQMINLKQYELMAPASLIFYGLALINGSRYTMGEVRFLGYGQLATGALAMLDLRHPLLWLSLGFGLLHIIYGIAMWWKYDRPQAETA